MSENPLQDELISKLLPFIEAKQIIVHQDDESWYSLIRNCFPIECGRIAWEKVPDAKSNFEAEPYIPTDGINCSDVVGQKADVIGSFLLKFAEGAGIKPQDHLIVLGDGCIELPLEMSFAILLDVFRELFSYPQHVYIMLPDASWCFMFSFESDMYFGQSPPWFNRPSINYRDTKL